MKYFVHYNMNIGGESAESLKSAISKGYRYLKDHPTSRKVINIFRQSSNTPMDSNVGIMYWDNVNGRRKIVFDSSNDKPGTYNIVNSDGSIGKKIPNRYKVMWSPNITGMMTISQRRVKK